MHIDLRIGITDAGHDHQGSGSRRRRRGVGMHFGLLVANHAHILTPRRRAQFIATNFDGDVLAFGWAIHHHGCLAFGLTVDDYIGKGTSADTINAPVFTSLAAD